ncbi:hypothetical protein B005_0672 [Nocardiopsis alba ATCC BAA-2165]|uniref:Uncharacterized protein n=1 Tax=Nocardiopsis alba (strain ATCC BAA-2165 / BE74) TaxID=1205910 RepID=J7KYL9_NOCAA|nr:hypothetical protein B005_0672 [Nocardiopsis alba ATCC BAA-2165]
MFRGWTSRGGASERLGRNGGMRFSQGIGGSIPEWDAGTGHVVPM